MAKKLAYERYFWLHRQIQAKRYPNARKLAEHFEISPKQAQRDIAFVRERMNAPLSFNRYKNGYEYEVSSYELPPVWFGEEGILALSLALRLASTLPDKGLKASLRQVLEKFVTFQFVDSPLALEDISRKVSVKNIQYAKVKETTFHSVIHALFRNIPLSIRYYSPHKNEMTERDILPLHLLSYMGNWHLISYCTLRRGIRDFALSRIVKIDQCAVSIQMPDNVPPIKDYIRRNFGLFSGEKHVEVYLRFAPEVSDWIAEQVWHHDQQVSHEEDGHVCLNFPVAHFKEIKGEIMKHGSHLEVLAPPELREEIRREIRKMNNMYG